MARTGKLSAVEVAKAKGPAVLHDGGGLYLRVSGKGTKSWVFRFQLDGKRRDMGLGPYPDISLAEARGRATEHRKLRHDGIDPLEAKEAQRQAQRLSAAQGRAFREVAEEFIARNEVGWRNAKHRQQWRNTLATYVYPVLGELSVAAIDTGLVIQVLDPIWTEKPETAGRVRGRIEAVLDAATVRGFRRGPNPAQWKGNLAHILPARARVRKAAHHAALRFDEMPAFLTNLQARSGMAARALEFAIYTAARTGEVLGATWSEVDLDAKVWTIPAERMKAGREHRVPLAGPALMLLEKLRSLALMRNGAPDPAAPIFPGPRRALPMSNMTMLMLLRRMKRDDLTAHGFRSTFSDWAAERTAYPREVVEMALAHAVENKVEAAYRRGDLFEKRRKLMEAWADLTPRRRPRRSSDPRRSSTVNPLRRQLFSR
jgi:integrase